MSVEPWLTGPVEGVPARLQPVAHALLNALADIDRLAQEGITDAELSQRPGGAAPVAFHLLHLTGALDRLLTYARGRTLDEGQRAALRRETDRAVQNELRAADAIASVRTGIAKALDILRATPAESLEDAREVGRARLPSTVAGLLFHAAEHTARHAGQAITTLRIVRGLATHVMD
jgi:hypothetical protein